MSVTNKIVDGFGTGNFAKVESGGYLRVQPAPFPPNDDRDTQIIFREFITLNNNGTTSDMRVDGSTTTQLFYIQAEPDSDIYITSLSFLLADTDNAPILEEFGALPTLTNGVRLYYEDSNGEIDIADSLKSNFEIVRLCQGTPAFGSGIDSFFVESVTSGAGNQFAIIPILNFQSLFGFQYGLRLRAGTTNKLVLAVRDDLTGGLDNFNIIAYGFKRLK